MMTRRAAVFVLLAGAAYARDYDVLVQGALDVELQPLVQALEGRREVQIHAWTFWTGRIAGRRVAISRTEVGPYNAAAATALGIERFRPRVVINQGTAGGHNRKLKLWDIVVGEKTVDFSAHRAPHAGEGEGQKPERWTPAPYKLRLDGRTQTEFPGFPGDRQLVESFMQLPYARGKVYRGVIGTAFQFNKELDRIAWLHKTYGTDTEDMESAASAAVATGMGVPFVAVRIVSNTEWESPTFERIAGQYCAEFVLEWLRRGEPLPARTRRGTSPR
ncbi:MAG: 5'-methylthioadenosine/S-adenosylhomocysteine nucleosidase [Bryobacteraceae bacterium]|nr:5'-methylthioadenosine/S-adenosylhomocysteine nucleosidase [Bryobacteraceae bacterium]